MIKAVLFDLDGTLVNSIYDLEASVNFALQKLRFPLRQTDEFYYFVGDGIPKMLERALPEGEKTEENVAKCLEIFMDRYKDHFCDKTVPYGGIPELVKTLKEKYGLKVAVISNKEEGMAIKVVTKLFGDIFDIIAGKREGYPAKPDPTLTLEIIGELGAAADECIFIGDSGMDMATAVNSGIDAIGAIWGFRTKEELLKSGARYTAETPLDAEPIIKSLING